VAEENSSCVMARKNYKQKYKGQDGTGGYLEYHQEKNIKVPKGHACRMDKDRRDNQILHWVPEGRKRRVRPRKNWTDTVGTTWEAWKYRGRERKSWRWIESSGEDALPDVQTCKGGTKV